TVKHWQDESIKYNEVGYYCEAPLRTKDFIHYWDDQKRKARTGVIYKSGDKQWFLSRDYYFWLNFLPIFDKEKNIYDFPLIWDIQYHMALYELLAELNNKHSVILKKRQIASEQPHSEPILGEHGWTTMGEVQPGDKLWNPDGTLTTILHKSNNGISDVYEFEFIDGRKTRCGIEHNWEVYDRTTKKIIILNTRDLLKKGINKEYKSGTHYRFAIKNTEPIEFKNTQELPIDPYVLGCILGDGSIGSSVYISGKDNDIFDEIQLTLGDKYKLTDVGYCKKNIVFKERFNKNSKYKNVKYGVNPLLRELDNLGLRVNNKGIKFIPEIYLNSSILDRICLIQGLMDTDGYINSTGNNIHFTNKNKDIIDGLAYICRSLGIKVTISEKTNRHGIYYRLLFSGNIPFEIFRLSRKQNRLVKRWGKNTFDLVPLISIKKLDYKEESSCIVVDNPNHLYITRDFIVTHNSYFHCAKLINYYWFEEGAKLKMGASLKDYINLKGSWKMLNEYSDFLNEHTAWIRPHNPGKVGDWEQKIQKTVNGRDITVGLKSTMGGYTFEKDATAGVGGPCRYFFHEEAGVAPKM
ncbi:MAG TPA: LAGLIDADG family homing endonuclease, partial [Candidatus Dojkabacteria bacterium]|nr:LAGLIDADG family homing endonuclease [Candidatus Dojkabacteria bacterium]